MKNLLLFAALLVAPSSSWAASTNWSANLDNGTGTVQFQAIGRPSAIKINGKGEAAHGLVTVSQGMASGKITFKLETLDTGMSTRNKHMKEKYLQVDKFPLAILTLDPTALPAGCDSGTCTGDALPFTGKLMLHGVETPVTGKAHVERARSSIKYSATFATKIPEHKIDLPTFAGITVAEDVTVMVEGSAPVMDSTGAK